MLLMLRLLSYRQIQFWEVHINWLVISTHQNLAIIATFMFKASSLRFQANEMDKNLTLKACSNLAKMWAAFSVLKLLISLSAVISDVFMAEVCSPYDQCDQIGQFLEFLCHKFYFKSSPNVL